MSKKAKKKKEAEEGSTESDLENFFTDEFRNEMTTMWQIPQIFHFLYLTKEALNIPHISLYEMERMLLVPKASKQLANVMTCLLSTPTTKMKLRKIPPMPYEFWTNILAHKLKNWFKIYESKHQDAVKVLETTGIEPEFWLVFPDAAALDGKDFEKLSFKQKLWLLKTVCDTVMHTRKTLQDEISRQRWEDQFETVLGTDRNGTRYIYFPQFLSEFHELRVYKHGMDNKILSSVKPKPRLLAKSEIAAKLERANGANNISKPRKRKSRWRNGCILKAKRRITYDNKDSSDCKYNGNNTVNVDLCNEDTNLSSTSACSNNNNNHIRLENITRKRLRSMSKMSEESVTSNGTRFSNTRSSGYDTNASSDVKSCDGESSRKAFKGFSDGDSSSDRQTQTSTENSLESRVTMKKGSTRQYLDVDSHKDSDELNERCVDNLSNSSKTDDEKLYEIIGAGSLKLSRNDETAPQISSSKSDDEKLSEVTTGDDNDEMERKKNLQRDRNGKRRIKTRLATEERKKEISNVYREKETEDSDADLDDEDLSSDESRDGFDNYSDDSNEAKYNLRRSRRRRTIKCKQEVDDFNNMLSELSVSTFHLVADSVESLRNLISGLTPKYEVRVNRGNGKGTDSVLSSETKLLKNLNELLANAEIMEPIIKETFRKARGKLQKEWTNFKEGMENQDSSSEGGLSSNWWVLGSQGCPLSSTDDTTLQTLSQSPLPSFGTETHQPEEEPEKQVDEGERNTCENQGCGKQSQEKTADGEKQGKCDGEEEEEQHRDNETAEELESKEEESEQQTRRVLRARGISSYTEQLFSDDEIDETELEEWTDAETVNAAPGTPTGAPASYPPPKVRYSDNWSQEEDSDQDWILPGTRKRKNKRSSINRRLKPFQVKLKNIRIEPLQEMSTPSPSDRLAATNSGKDKSKPKEYKPTKEFQPKKSADLQAHNVSDISNLKLAGREDPKETVPSTESLCKLTMNSVHSELDIKDEGPIYEPMPPQYDNGYSTNEQQNYLTGKADQNPMNYCVMPNSPLTRIVQQPLIQQGTHVSGAVPSVPQSYYVQGPHNYIVHHTSPPASFLPPRQSGFQQQGPQMMAPQQFVNHQGYMQYTMATPPPQSSFVAAPFPRPDMMSNMITQQQQASPSVSLPPMPGQYVKTSNRSTQNKNPIPRQAVPHPNGAVIRSSMPIRGSFPRQRTPNPNVNNSNSNNNGGNVSVQQQRVSTKPQRQQKKSVSKPTETAGRKTTSLIVLSDSDDEIEMIITENVDAGNAKALPRKSTTNSSQPTQIPTITSEITLSTSKGVISPQIIQRMSQGGISITPVKPAAPVQNTSTQLVVVVNETGSHYALALPNGSKLILTPEQVAQIRASNGGKLIL